WQLHPQPSMNVCWIRSSLNSNRLETGLSALFPNLRQFLRTADDYDLFRINPIQRKPSTAQRALRSRKSPSYLPTSKVQPHCTIRLGMPKPFSWYDST